jgi:hypothetical protein
VPPVDCYAEELRGATAASSQTRTALADPACFGRAPLLKVLLDVNVALSRRARDLELDGEARASLEAIRVTIKCS